jgi:hypothetical protein
MTAFSLDGGNPTYSAIPSGYSGGVNIYPATDSGAIMGTAYKNFTGTGEDPPVYGTGNEQWVAVTLALPYAT